MKWKTFTIFAACTHTNLMKRNVSATVSSGDVVRIWGGGEEKKPNQQCVLPLNLHHQAVGCLPLPSLMEDCIIFKSKLKQDELK